MYYMIKVKSIYPSGYNLLMLNQVRTSNLDAILTYVSVDSYEYSGNGKLIFSENPTKRWQTNRSDPFPHYIVFTSNVTLVNIILNSGEKASGGYVIKDFGVYRSEVKLTYTSNAWVLIYSGTMENVAGVEQHFSLSNFLIKSNNQYYSILPELYNRITRQYDPLETADFTKSFNPNDLFKTTNINENINTTPVMTSNTSPTPYVVTSSSYYDERYLPWKAFSGTNIDLVDCWATKKGTVTGWIAIDMNTSTAINILKLTSRNYQYETTSNPKNFTLQGSDDGITFDTIKTFSNETNWGINKAREYTLDNDVTYRYYKIDVTANNGLPDYLSIGKIQFCYRATSENFKPIDKFQSFQLITDDIKRAVAINAIQSFRQLIIANNDIKLSVANNIDYFKITISATKATSIKLALSIDSGLTWLTCDGIDFHQLESTAVMKDLSEMTEEEKIQWDILKEDIFTNGITPDVFNLIDFNKLNSPKVRFAYVIDRPSYSDTSEIGQLDWQFDAKGSMQNMKETEYTIQLLEGQIRITSLIDASIIKANVIV